MRIHKMFVGFLALALMLFVLRRDRQRLAAKIGNTTILTTRLKGQPRPAPMQNLQLVLSILTVEKSDFPLLHSWVTQPSPTKRTARIQLLFLTKIWLYR